MVSFVAVVGGAVVWIRFDALHLPADKVVAVLPRTDLIVIGLSTLIPFILMGLIVVAAAYVFAPKKLNPGVALDDLQARWSGSTLRNELAAATLAPGADPD